LAFCSVFVYLRFQIILEAHAEAYGRSTSTRISSIDQRGLTASDPADGLVLPPQNVSPLQQSDFVRDKACRPRCKTVLMRSVATFKQGFSAFFVTCMAELTGGVSISNTHANGLPLWALL
jgi:hypothetical protein